MSEFSEFTKLVLARMETNPDEFQPGDRWDTLVRGLEAHAMGDTESRYVKTLWPLEDAEVHALLATYRKVYLARIHKDMLRNIVSGNDKQYGMTLGGNDINPIKGRPLGAQALTATEYDLARDTYSAVVKQEGAPVDITPRNRYVMNASQIAVAQKLGVDPVAYAQHLRKYEE